MNVIPPQQYLPSYVFFTDRTYSETELVFVRQSVNGVFQDATLDCAGGITGWQPLGSDYEWTHVDLSTGSFQPVGNCNTGRRGDGRPRSLRGRPLGPHQ